MDYRKAQSLKKKSLLSLIAENKFESGMGIGSSVGHAISDKFKAKVTRAKMAIHPLNFLSKVYGKGIIGKSLTTITGRAFGVSDEKIGAFGGYIRKGKDPLYTKIGPKQLQPVKTGDSVADILAKTYNLMRENFDDEKLHYELMKDFEKENKEKSDRKYKKLEKSLKEKKPEKEKKEELKKDGIEEKILGWFKKIKDWAKKIMVGAIISIRNKFASALEPLKNFGKMGSEFFNKFIKKMGFLNILEKFFEKGLMSTLLSVFSRFIFNPAVLTVIAGAVTAYIGKKGLNIEQEMRGGKKSVKLQSQIEDIESKEWQEGVHVGLSDTDKKRLEQLKKERNESIKNYEDAVLTPYLKKKGYEKTDSKDYYGHSIYENVEKGKQWKNVEKAKNDLKELNKFVPLWPSEVDAHNKKESELRQKLKEEQKKYDDIPGDRYWSPTVFGGDDSELRNKIILQDLGISDDTSNDQSESSNNLSKSLKSLQNFSIPSSDDIIKKIPGLQDDSDSGDNIPQNVNINKTNNIGGKSSTNYTTPINPRNSLSSLEKSSYKNTAFV